MPRKKKTKKKAAKKKKTAKKKKKAAKKKTAKKKKAKKKTSKKASRKKATRKKTAKKKKTAAKRKRAKKKAPSKKAKKKKARRRSPRGKAFFDHFREKLLTERSKIERRLADLRDELRGIQERPRELEEWAQEEKDRDILIRLEQREMDELRRIQTALAMIDSKQYGKCQVCNKPIPKARLEELPTAFRCVQHSG